MTALALLVVIATWSLLIGGSRIAFAISSAQAGPGAWSIALGGVLLVLLGVLLVVNPGAGAIGITWAIGWLAFLFGTARAVARLRRPPRDPRADDAARHPGLAARTRGRSDMTSTAAATRTLRSPAVGTHEVRRRGSAPAPCRA